MKLNIETYSPQDIEDALDELFGRDWNITHTEICAGIHDFTLTPKEGEGERVLKLEGLVELQHYCGLTEWQIRIY